VWIAFHKLRSNLSFWVEPMSNKSMVWDYQTPQSCFYYQWQPQLHCQTGTILQWYTWAVHVHGEPVNLHHHVLQMACMTCLPARADIKWIFFATVNHGGSVGYRNEIKITDTETLISSNILLLDIILSSFSLYLYLY
jgi:hypothetical protein